jgi:dTDP-4-dehydrorhamnose 3,5-epimerase
MNVKETNIPDVLLFEPIVFGDSRGYFFEYFRQEIIDKNMPGTNFVQGN